MAKRRRRNPDVVSNIKDIAIIAGVGIGGYLLYEFFQGAKKPLQTVASIANQTSELFDTTPDPGAQTFASWYDPTQRIVFFYYLTFPDGSQHFVWASDVNQDGTFTYDGALYRIGTDNSGGLRAYSYVYQGMGVLGARW